MNKHITAAVLWTTLLAAQTTWSGKHPRGCEITGFGFSEQFLVLNAEDTQTFYLLKNKSDKRVQLERHETRDVFMSPKMKTELSPNRWAAFACDVENLHLQCLQNDNGHTQVVNCEDVLELCQYPRVKFALSNMGNYWVSSNKSQRAVIKEAIKKGILLRW